MIDLQKEMQSCAFARGHRPAGGQFDFGIAAIDIFGGIAICLIAYLAFNTALGRKILRGVLLTLAGMALCVTVWAFAAYVVIPHARLSGRVGHNYWSHP